MVEKTDIRMVERMSLWQRVEHGLLALCVVLLIVTGLARVYHTHGWAQELIRWMGGLVGEETLHHWAAAGLIAAGLLHVTGLALSRAHRQDFRGLAFRKGDLARALQGIRLELTGKGEPPAHGRFTTMQKVQYWGIMLSCLLMALTGTILWAHNAFQEVLPAWSLSLVRVLHSSQAQLIFVVLILWHLYDVHLGSGNFPMNPAWLTGRMRESVFLRQHRSAGEREGGA
jgi:formate dehydrogenase subunit gamma